MSGEAKILCMEDYLAMPETIQHYEIVDGELIMPPAPTLYHQWITKKLLFALDHHVQINQLGIVLCAPVDVLIRQPPVQTRQPDVLYINVERSGFKDSDSLIGIQLLEVAPDLIVEILSSSDTRRKVKEKLADYQTIEVRECWLVSPEAQTVEVLKFTPEETERIGIFGIGQKLSSEVLPRLTLLVDDIFS
ncbi:Uma2 family endonuclease [bacterium]|nr:Uma2 family endonuclease [bacterium]